MSGRILLWSITSALAGFLFGFDTVVISGAEQKIQTLWGLGAGAHGLAMASALYGTVIGALFAGWPAERFGRRATLIGVGVLYVISAIGSAAAPGVFVFTLARFLGGVGIGVSTVAAPLYISEIAPAQSRGRLTGMFQLNIVFGIVMAYVSNAALVGVGEEAWRWMLGIAALPSVLYTALCLWMPESPRWLLVTRRDREAGVGVLRLIQPQASAGEIDRQAQEILAGATGVARGPLWTPALRKPIVLVILLAFFNQMSGINAVLYFAPRIFAMAGLGAQAALLQSIGIGLTNLIFTLIGVWLIDRLGRRTLLYIGSLGYIASLGLLSWAFFTGHHAIVPSSLFLFCAAHAIGQGTVIWVLISEVFPQRQRAQGQALGSGTHWVFAALITSVFPKLVTAFEPGYVFLFFCMMMVLQLIWVKVSVVETKGVPLEELARRLGTDGAQEGVRRAEAV